jgi:lipopolysaccharide export system permease protein
MRGNDQLLLLENGQRIERLDDKNALKISEFQEYGTKTGGTDNMTADATEAKLLSTRDLIKAPTPVNRSELAWRLGLLLSAINLVVLAVALASVNPRGGRSGNMIFVLLTFIVYNNLLNLGQNWIYSGMVSFSGFIVTLHGGVLLLGLTWLAKRHSNWTIRSMFSAKRRSVDNENTSA